MATTVKYFGPTDTLYLIQLVYTELQKYVLAQQGMGLSSNDFTTALKNKLEGIDIPALETYINNQLALKANLAGAEFTGTVKAPTAAAGTNDTTVASTAYVTAAIATAISSVVGIRFDADTSGQGYTSLSDLQTKHPIGDSGTIYLVQNSGSGANTKDEYFWNGDSSSGTYELFGSTSIDLSNYLQVTDVVEMTTTEVKAAWDAVFTPSGS